MTILRYPTGRAPFTDYVVFKHKKYLPNNVMRQNARDKIEENLGIKSPEGSPADGRQYDASQGNVRPGNNGYGDFKFDDRTRRGFARFERNFTYGKNQNRDAPYSRNTIALYMPSTIPGMKSAQSWNSTGNTFGLPSTRMMTRAVSTLLGGTGNNPFPTAQELGDALKYETYGRAGQFVTGTSINEFLTLTGGAIFNPNVEMLYDGLATRSFQFDFFMIANNEEDRQAITDIILEFKRYSSPSTGRYNEGSNGNWLTVPHLWDVAYKTSNDVNVKDPRNLRYFNKFKSAVIRAINVQDNAGLNYHATFAKKDPIVTAVSIEFAEVDIITREDHEDAVLEGYIRGY